jgi:transposase-like protein
VSIPGHEREQPRKQAVAEEHTRERAHHQHPIEPPKHRQECDQEQRSVRHADLREQIIPFYSFAPEVRKIIYTTNAIESLHMQLRKVLKNRGHFPSDEAATKLICLALRNITKSWQNPPLTWRMAANQFTIQFGQRFNK